jgi:hypothetical protein
MERTLLLFPWHVGPAAGQWWMQGHCFARGGGDVQSCSLQSCMPSDLFLHCDLTSS